MIFRGIEARSDGSLAKVPAMTRAREEAVEAGTPRKFANQNVLWLLHLISGLLSIRFAAALMKME